ncbi:alpha-amylase family glycosyl hydrolase [Nonomuraea sp. NPDC050153]|uniref:alpha-amylase family glycosyl hydrolase n=1 Tax=Nonomuraea sp. NPDC050153 TaxID=3364359 RepID=UPI0037A78365
MYPDSVAALRLDPVPGRVHHPSPGDWRDEVGYSVLIDRFAHAGFRAHVGDPAHGDTRHGGNLPGVTANLDYLRTLGVTVLQLSPVTRADPECYHHYGPAHLTRVDPHLGTLDDLVELVDQAHRRGIRVILDLVVNHMGRVFEYTGGDHFRQAPADIARWTAGVGPGEFADASRFTRRGVIEDWKDPEQAVRGDFPPGLRRLATEDASTARLLITVAQWWIRATDVDGFRIDAVRHLEPAFVTGLAAEVKKYAAGLGKHDFLVLGEYSATDDAPLAECLRLGVDSVYNYPEYRRQSWALHGQAPTLALEESLLRARAAWTEDAHDRTVRFIDNHDVYRFLREGEPLGRLHVALAFLAYSTGIPMLYYGTEQGFRQPTGRLERECSADRAAPRNREDMFADGAFTSPSSAGDRFDTASETFEWTRRLLDVRRHFEALRRGRQVPRLADPRGPGLYGFSRLTREQEVLVVLNTADRPRHAVIPVGPLLGGRDVLADALDPELRAAPGPDGVAVTVPGHGVRVLTGPDGSLPGSGVRVRTSPDAS